VVAREYDEFCPWRDRGREHGLGERFRFRRGDAAAGGHCSYGADRRDFPAAGRSSEFDGDSYCVAGRGRLCHSRAADADAIEIRREQMTKPPGRAALSLYF
jgi:hypothetical protein